MEPRPLRLRYRPPKTFLQHIDFTDLKREQDYHHAMHPTGQKQLKIKLTEKPINNVKKPVKQSARKGNHSNSNNSHSSPAPSSYTSTSAPGNNSTHTISSSTTSTARNRSSPPSVDNSEFRGSSTTEFLASATHLDDPDIFFETTLLLYALPDEVRQEVDLLLSDLLVRLKQLLFNSLLCAYYVGFIPVQFADVRTVEQKN